MLFSLILVEIINENYQVKLKLEKLNSDLNTANQSLLRTFDELKEAKNQADSASLAKSEFLSSMSHELRTPMNAVIGMTHLLLEDNPRPNQVEKLNLLKFSSTNLLSIINDILDFNKIEEGKIEFEEFDFGIKQLLANLKKTFEIKAREKTY